MLQSSCHRHSDRSPPQSPASVTVSAASGAHKALRLSKRTNVYTKKCWKNVFWRNFKHLPNKNCPGALFPGHTCQASGAAGWARRRPASPAARPAAAPGLAWPHTNHRPPVDCIPMPSAGKATNLARTRQALREGSHCHKNAHKNLLWLRHAQQICTSFGRKRVGSATEVNFATCRHQKRCSAAISSSSSTTSTSA